MKHPSRSQPSKTMGHLGYSSMHNSSSASSAFTNPNEDWTKIADPPERRRIQNRIAQRNYRKKFKRSREHLERRAGSTSVSSEKGPLKPAALNLSLPSQSQPQSQLSKVSTRKDSQSGHNLSIRTSPNFQESLFGPQALTQLITSPPPPFSYFACMPNILETCRTESQQIPTVGLPMKYANYADPQQQCHSSILPPRLNRLSQSPQKEGNLFGGDDFPDSFSATYAAITGLDHSQASYPWKESM